MNSPERPPEPTDHRLSFSPETAVAGFAATGLGIVMAALSFVLFWQIRRQPSPSLASPLQSILLLLGVTALLFAGATTVAAIRARQFARGRDQVEIALRRRNEYLAALHETTLSLFNRLELLPLLESIVARAGALLDAPHGYVDLVLPDNSALETKVGRGAFSAFVGAQLASGEGLGGRVWQSGQPLAVDDYPSWPGHSAHYATREYHAIVGVPLRSGNQVVGVIGLAYSEHGRIFGQSQIEILSRFAEIASLALENARLYTAAQDELAERKRAGELRNAIYRIAQEASQADSLDELFHSLHKVITTIMPADNFYIALYNEKQDLLSFPYFVDEVDTPPPPHKPGAGLTEYVLRTAAPLLCTAEIQEELERSGEAVVVGVPSPIWLGVPLLVDKKAIGVMAVQHHSDPKAYNENDLRVLEFVSTEVARAIDLTRAQEDGQRERNFALQVMNTVGQGLAVTGPDKQFEFVNPAYAGLLGYKPEDLIGKGPEDVTWPDDLAIMKEHGSRRRAGETTSYELRLRHANGQAVPVLVTDTPRRQDGRVVGAITGVTDLIERKQAEAALRKSEQRFRSLAENVPGVIYQCKNDDRFTMLYLNDAIEALTGYPKEDFLEGRLSINDLNHPEDAASVDSHGLISHAIAHQQRFHRLYRLRHKSGEWRWVEEWGTGVAAKDGVPQLLEGVMIDITERKRAEAQLERNARELAALSHMGQVVAATLDLSVVLKKVIDEASPLLQAEGISILLPEGQNKLVFAAASGPASAGMVGHRIPFMASAAGGVMQTGRSARISSGESESQLYREVEPHRRHHTRSVLAVPLGLGGEVIGVMEAVHTQPNAFTAEDQRLLEAAANWAAIAIGNARHHERIQRRLHESEAMATISRALNETLDLQVILQLIVDSAMRLIPSATRAVIHMFDEMQQLLMPVAASGERPSGGHEVALQPGEGVGGRVFSEGILINVGNTTTLPDFSLPHAQTPLISLLAVPVESGAHRLGILNVDSSEPDAFSTDDERLLTNLSVQAALAIENARLFEAARHRVDELNTASEILRLLNAAPSIAHAFPSIAAGLQAITGCERVSLALLDDNEQWLTIVALDQPRPELGVGARIPAQDASAAVTDILNGRVHLTPDLSIETTAPVERVMFEAGYRSRINLPLRAGERVVGCLNLNWLKINGYNTTQLLLLEQIADAIALALEKSRLFNETTHALAREQRLNEVARAISSALESPAILQNIPRLAAELVGADAASLALVDADWQNISTLHVFNLPEAILHKPIPRGQGVAWQVVESGRPLLVPDYRSHPASISEWARIGICAFIGVPIIAGHDRLGVLGLSHLSPDKTFTARDLGLAESVALQAGAAIQNARLFEAAGRRADELNAASEILRELNAAPSIAEAFPAIADGLKAITGCERVSLGLYEEDYHLYTIVALDLPRPEVGVGVRLRVNRDSDITRDALNGRTHLTPDLATEPDTAGQPALYAAGYRSRMNLPLRAGGRTLGTINLNWLTTNGYKLAQLPLLEQITDAIALAVEKNRLFNETTETLIREQRLNEIARATSGAVDLPTILSNITRLTAELVNADAASLALVDEARANIDFVHFYNAPGFSVHTPVPRGVGVAWQIIETGDSLLLTDYRTHPNALPEWVEAGARAFLGVPIGVGLDRFGVLGLFGLNPDNSFTARDVSLAESVGLQAGVAIQNARLFEALQKRATELATVAQVSIDAATILSPDELLQKVVDLTEISFHLYHADIYLINEAGDKLVLAAGSAEVGRKLVAAGHQIALAQEQSVVARVARTRQGIIVNNVSKETLFLPNPHLPDTQSEMAIPMVISDQLLGVFDVQSGSVNRFTDEDVRIQSTLAAQVAVALQNARLFDAERQRVEALTGLHEIGLELGTELDLSSLLHSIVERAARLLNASSGDFCLALPDGQTLELSVGYNVPAKYIGRRMKLGEGAAGRAAQTGEPVIVDNYDNGPGGAQTTNSGPFRSILSMPVAWRGQVIGVISVSDGRTSRFSSTDTELVGLFADQAAVAIATARQHEELQRRLQETDALAAINRAFNGTLDLQRVLLLIVEAAGRIIPNVDRAVIHLLDENGQTLRPAAITGVGDPIQSQIIMRPGEGIAGQVIAQGIVINVADTQTDSRYLMPERASRTRSLLVAPVQSGPHRLGTLSVNSGKPHAFSADDERLLGTLGVQAALAIYNAQLFEDTRRQLDELLLLHTVAIAGAEATSEDVLIERASRLVGETLNSVNFGVMLLDEDSSYLRAHYSYRNSPGEPIPLGRGITGRVAATGQPWLVQDVGNEPAYLNVDPNARSELCVPLKAGNLVLGVINAESDRVKGFSETDQRLLATLAGQLATAIQKLRLYRDLEQALRQEKAARTQLVQSEKLAAMGRLVASVAHELNNPLQAIQNALYLVRQEPDLSMQSMEDLQVASTEADRMAELIGRLRETYRPTTGEEFRLESLNTLVGEVQKLIATHLRHNGIQFRFDADPALPLIPGIRDQLKQVMLNLSLNAVEAMPNGGALTIRTCRQPASSGVLLSIHDTGIGIPPDALSNVFDPFFTTKETGTGLGLTITYDIVQRHKGRIEVESESGMGTTFTIWLPVEIESELT